MHSWLKIAHIKLKNILFKKMISRFEAIIVSQTILKSCPKMKLIVNDFGQIHLEQQQQIDLLEMNQGQ